MQNTWWSMVLVYPTFTIPFCTWLLMGFFKSIPCDIEEQAMVDGYSRLGAIWRTVLPRVAAGDADRGRLLLRADPARVRLRAGLRDLIATRRRSSIGVTTELIRGDVFFWQSLMAAAAIVAIPVAFLYNLFLDRFIAGFTLGAVKG